ncbi:hypothetical protein BABINDRAFT_165333 [Babjeviella inositovora NRRL Y-12698]|uniref:Uncharacterized protein n=1 Tax=Babjeviella inositovora NRRL Y-12698 TaxID=984486 RepID=A0A1E3QXL5_9ASCO|nr:uncharacterized protein BABINDRAFT_165333 [Babjeviella inositovora NRRL Y-12698]ODQ81812.1 hypothetical protein BABINDRAFT_165333 [Babjeviella inositovora NRRL Y-12698]
MARQIQLSEEVAKQVETLSVENRLQAPKEEAHRTKSPKKAAGAAKKFIRNRFKLFEEVKAQQNTEISAKERVSIKLTLKDGTGKEERQDISRVNSELWDLEHPFEGDATLEFFDSLDGKAIFWHFSTHILGEAFVGDVQLQQVQAVPHPVQDSQRHLKSLEKAASKDHRFDEVITPDMYNSKLCEVSGHRANYKNDVFVFDGEKETFGLKPMNCPGYCSMFKDRKRSYRPEKYVGELSTRDNAESQLERCWNKRGGKWSINPGDGAFYDPKIGILISDALKGWHQCATIQLDFRLPNQFELEYTPQESLAGTTKPVMVHRAILGSVERMTTILAEHFARKWPFWLSPRQVLVVPAGVGYFEYAETVNAKLKAAGFRSDVDVSNNTLQKKVRNSQVSKHNFVFIVGTEE